MKKIISALLAAVLAVSLFTLLGGCAGSGSIEEVVMEQSHTGSVAINNYKVNLKDNVDWAALSDEERQEIATAGFNQAQKQIKDDGVYSYTITGNTANGTLAFIYDLTNQEMLVMLEGQMGTTFPLESPKVN